MTPQPINNRPPVNKPLRNSSSHRPGTDEQELMHFSGLLVLVVFLALLFYFGTQVWSIMTSGTRYPSQVSNFGITVVLFFILVFIKSGFRILQPNIALVATFFGNYSGTLDNSGFFWILPLYSTERVSTKTNNHVTPILKVNDGNGNPIEIAAAVVWHIDRPAASVYDVENVKGYIQVQCESAVRALASNHPYESDKEGATSLRLHADEVIHELVTILQERLKQAGVKVDEARFTHLAYAPEIAQAMLRKQQAQSVVAARATIVEGAVSMVENAVNELEKRKVVILDQKDRARLVTNMLTVLLSEEGAHPVVNIGSGEH